MAEEPKLPCVPHSAILALVIVITSLTLGAIPNVGNHVEFTIESDEWSRDVYLGLAQK